MRKTFLISLLLFAPAVVYGFTADDFTVNNQSTYAVPPGSTRVLILDLSLPEPISSIKIQNEGTVQQYNISRLQIYKDGSSAGWDGDEGVIFTKSESPFWDDEFTLPSFSATRIFVTVDIDSDTVSGRTIIPKAIISGAEISGFERGVLASASWPEVPAAPWAVDGEALSSSAIRWHFTDKSSNEFGFKILDSSLKEVVRTETADISYIDETGLEPGTEYPGRRVVAFNDIGESPFSVLSIFSAVQTPPLPPVEEETEEITEEPSEEESVEEETPQEEAVAEQGEETAAEKPVAEMTPLEITAKIAEILAQIEALQSQLTEKEETVTGCAVASFTRSLKEGMSGEDVKCLQIVLNSDVQTRLTASGVGSPGEETTYFGSLTKEAVIRFQEKYASEVLATYGLTSGTGFVGQTTRAKLNEILGE